MSANQRHVARPRRLHEVVQKLARAVRVDAFRQQQRGHQPAGARAGGDEVVLVDREQIVGKLGTAEGDRVGRGDEELIAAEIQHGGVFPNSRTEDHVGRRGGHPTQKLAEQLGRQLAGGKVHVRAP